jgi:hypothetical protein
MIFFPLLTVFNLVKIFVQIFVQVLEPRLRIGLILSLIRRIFSPGGSKAYMLKNVPNIERIINNDILKTVK